MKSVVELHSEFNEFDEWVRNDCNGNFDTACKKLGIQLDATTTVSGYNFACYNFACGNCKSCKHCRIEKKEEWEYVELTFGKDSEYETFSREKSK